MLLSSLVPPVLAPASSWARPSLKHLLNSARMGALQVPAAFLVNSSSIEEYLLPRFVSVVARTDIMEHPQDVDLKIAARGMLDYHIDDDLERAPAGALLVALDSASGYVVGCKIAEDSMLVLPTVFILDVKSTVDKKWLRHALLGMAQQPAPPGVGNGLEALLQKKNSYPINPGSNRDRRAFGQNDGSFEQDRRSTASFR
jgi:hypothetical protein